jgi:tetratricopeptide (TPR) repeat protein
LERWDEAFHAYHEALSRDPLLADGHVGLGVLADQAGELREALAHFQRAVELEPGHADYRLLLASTFSKLEQHEAAEREYLAAVQADPKLTDAWLERLDHLQLRDLHPEALAVAEEALGIVPDDADLLYRKFFSLYALQRTAEAFVLLERLLMHHYDGALNLLTLYPALANDARFMDRYERFKP